MPCCHSASTGLGQVIPRITFSPFVDAGIPAAAASQIAAHQARLASCTSTCAALKQQFPQLYPVGSEGMCRLQCMTSKHLSPLEAICTHRYNQNPGLIPGCVAAGGGSPVTGGDADPAAPDEPTPEGIGRPLWQWLAIGGAVLGIGYVGYRLLKG